MLSAIDSQPFHSTSGVGHLGTPTTGVLARVYYAANYYDNVDRVIASADAGTNGGTAWTRPSTVPSSSPTLLVSQYQYQYTSSGMIEDDIDPMGIDRRTYYDNLGRVTKSVQNYTGNPETTNSDVATEYGYDGNDNVVYVQADEPGGAYQKTAYIYGVTTTAGDGANSNDILSAIQHPDPSTGNPSSSQQDSYLTNALGDVVQSTDRNGSVHQYSYDVLGRLTADNVSTLGTGVDGTVRQMTYAYDSQGNNYLITSLNSSGSIVNQVQRVYNGLGQLTGEYQSHSGTVVQGSTTQVQYTYNEMQNGENNSRLTSIVYPVNGSLYYNYNSGLDDRISRLSSLSGSAYVLESYIYLGLDTVVERDHAQNNVNLSYIYQTGDANANHDGGDQYTGLDRFGRVIDQNWVNGTNGTSTDRFQYGYNQDSEVVSRNNTLDAAMNETYSYDNLGQLTSFARGSHTQTWTPDALGNFTSVTTNGTTQTRTANQQNEYTSISGAGTITYDANGNITADGSGNTYVYDAWNRLVAVKNGTTTLAAYSYDGLGRRISGTEGGTTTDLYYSAAAQVLEEDVNGVVQAQNVWSAVYVNALVLRDQSSQHNGVLDQRLYVQQDANWNVTALVDSSGNVVERYDYDPFGAATVLNPDFSVRGTSSYNWNYLFQGKRYDGAAGLYDSRERVYSPTLMRPLQADPLGLGAGNNDYAFVNDGPTNAVDPSGLIKFVDHPFWGTASGKEWRAKIIRAAQYAKTSARKLLEAAEKVNPTKEEDKKKLEDYKKQLRFIIDNVDNMEINPNGGTHDLPGAQAQPDLGGFNKNGTMRVTFYLLYMYNFHGKDCKPYGKDEGKLVLPLPGHMGLNNDALKSLRLERLPGMMDWNEKNRKHFKQAEPLVMPWTEEQIAALLANELMHFFGQKNMPEYTVEKGVVKYKHFFDNPIGSPGVHTWSFLDSLDPETRKSYDDPRSADHIMQSIYFGRMFWTPK